MALGTIISDLLADLHILQFLNHPGTEKRHINKAVMAEKIDRTVI